MAITQNFTNTVVKRLDEATVPPEGYQVLTSNYQAVVDAAPANNVSIGPLYQLLSGLAFTFDADSFRSPSKTTQIRSIEVNLLHIRGAAGQNARLFIYFPDTGKYFILGTATASSDATLSTVLNVGFNVSTLSRQFQIVLQGQPGETFNLSLSVNNFEIQPYTFDGIWKETI